MLDAGISSLEGMSGILAIVRRNEGDEVGCASEGCKLLEGGRL